MRITMRIKLIHHGDCQLIAQKFGCSPQTVSYALNFKHNSMISRKIRHFAMNEMSSVIM